MSNDIVFVIGVIFWILAIPALVGAFSESRPPRAALIMVVLGSGLIFFAVRQQPGSYSIDLLPDVFMRAFRDLF